MEQDKQQNYSLCFVVAFLLRLRNQKAVWSEIISFLITLWKYHHLTYALFFWFFTENENYFMITCGYLFSFSDWFLYISVELSIGQTGWNLCQFHLFFYRGDFVWFVYNRRYFLHRRSSCAYILFLPLSQLFCFLIFFLYEVSPKWLVLKEKTVLKAVHWLPG